MREKKRLGGRRGAQRLRSFAELTNPVT